MSCDFTVHSGRLSPGFVGTLEPPFIIALMDPLDYFDRAAAAVGKIVNSVEDDQLTLPTTCPLWNVRTVINHIALGAARVAAWVTGDPAPPWETDYLGTDFRADVAGAIARARAAFAAPGALNAEVEAAFGPATGALLVTMVVNEFLTHGWDVADATGQSTDLDGEVAELALAASSNRFAGVPRPPGGPFGPEQPAPREASSADRLAAFLGRQKLHAALDRTD